MKTNLNHTNATATIVRTGVVAAGLIGAMIIASPATAASACKGLENSACAANASCGWVNGYERKDGRTVKPFCRSSTTKQVKSSVAKK